MDVKSVFRNPKVLIVIGVGAVGGIYLASRLKGKSTPQAENVPTEVPVSYKVESADSVQEQDTLQRSLTDATQKYNELTAQQENDRKAYQDKLDALTLQNASEREQYQQRLTQQQATLGSQFSSQINSLKATIDSLQKQLNAKTIQQTAPQNTVVPQSQPSSKIQPSPGNTVVKPVAPVKHYPGLPDNYNMDCSAVSPAFRVILKPNWDEALRTQTIKKLSSTSTARNMSAMAIGGTTDWLVIGWDRLLVPSYRAYVNTARVRGGLFPLTDSEFDEMAKQAKSLWPDLNERNPNFQNLTYARTLWERWNRPYQCGNSTVRR